MGTGRRGLEGEAMFFGERDTRHRCDEGIALTGNCIVQFGYGNKRLKDCKGQDPEGQAKGGDSPVPLHE